MSAELKQNTKALYDRDYHLWILETVRSLQQRDMESLDWENLIEEVADLGRRDKKRLKSLLRNLVEHVLKLAYWQVERERNCAHWKAEITNFRKQILDELEDSPSLKRYLEDIYQDCYQDGREIAALRSQSPLSIFPEKPLVSLHQILDETWFPPIS
jgi:hypothetical protein